MTHYNLGFQGPIRTVGALIHMCHMTYVLCIVLYAPSTIDGTEHITCCARCLPDVQVFIADGDDSIAFLKLEYYDNTGYYPRPPSNAKSLTLQADEYITTAYVCQDDGIDSTPRGVAFVTNKGNHIEGGRSTNNCPNLQVVQAPKDFGSEKYPPRLHAVQTLTTDHVLTLRLFFGSLMNMPIQR